MLALFELAAHLNGADVGSRRAKPALAIVATVVAESVGEFDWGEHWIQRDDGEMQCQYCGANFNPLDLDLGCSGVE